MSEPPSDDYNPKDSEHAFLEWIAAEVRAKMLRSLPPSEREEATRRFQAALGYILCHTPLPAGASGLSAVAEIAGRARIAATFGAIHEEERPEDPLPPL
ncbi:hypothetical protein [Muricoccus radiodurans]|uniref:hypothetical protein n=1 Tax=Muricoccus radiodurans TaxID=2231721 RepID=UPI003CF0BE33